MAIKNHIPNFFTCMNLAIGCLAVIAIFEGSLDNIIFYVLIAGVFDFFDGFAARILNATSPIGKDLDSLADMVTFGIVPSLLMYALLKNNSSSDLLPYAGILIAVFSGLRLAKFNNDERQSDTFYGLPTPANAMFICCLPLLIESDLPVEWLQNEFVLLAIIIIFSALMVMDVRLLALKFKDFKWKNNQLRYVLILSSLVLIASFGIISLALIIIVYILLSISSNIFAKN